jgi:hypothetical protein
VAIDQRGQTDDAWRHQIEFARHWALVAFEAIVHGAAK